MEYDPTRVCELLVGLGDVEVLGVDDEAGVPLRVRVRRRAARPGCGGCGGALWSNGERPVELVDLPAFGRAVRLAQAPLALPAARMPGAAEETLRSLYDIADHTTGAATVDQLASDLQDPGMPPEINRLGRTIWRWRRQISNWHTARVTNAATEAANNLAKRVKRAAFGY